MAIAGDYDESGERSKLLRTHPPYSHDSYDNTSVLEDPKVYKSRWRSIRVMYLTMFLSSVSFSICMSSVWPYLKLLDPTAKADFLGWVVASYSLGQLIASPLFGAWATKTGKSREPLVVSLVINILANILYIYLESIPSHRDACLVVARAFIGFGAGNVAVVRSYVSGATTLKERTPAMANISAFQAIGFIIGPAIQTAMVPIGYPGLVHVPELHIDLYTSPAILSAICGVINLLLVIIIFKEHRVENDSDVNFSIQESLEIPDYSVDKVAVLSSIFIFFIVLFLFSVFETIGTPLTMNMFLWTKSEATLYNGVILAVGGVVSILVFIVIKILSKRLNERYLLIGGFFFCLTGFFVYLPWGDNYPSYMDNNIQPAPTLPSNHTFIIDNATSVPWTVPTRNSTLPSEASSTYTHQPFTLQNATLVPTTEISTEISTLFTTAENSISTGESTVAPTTENSTPTENPTTASTTESTELTTSSTEASTVTEINIRNGTVIPTSERYINITGIDIENATEHMPKVTRVATVTAINIDNGTEITTTEHYMNVTGRDLENSTNNNWTEVATATEINSGNSSNVSSTTHYMNVTARDIDNVTDHGVTDVVSVTHINIGNGTEKQVSEHYHKFTVTNMKNPSQHPTKVFNLNPMNDNKRSETGDLVKENIDSLFDQTIEISTHSSWTEYTTNHSGKTSTTNGSKTTVEPVGCPDTYQWCRYTPVVTLAQFLIGTLLICIGYPTCNVMTYTIYSKILGPKPQGLWMGLLTASGSLARTLGPIFVGQIYNSYGPRVTFSIVVGLIFATVLILIGVFKKLVPFSFTNTLTGTDSKEYLDE